MKGKYEYSIKVYVLLFLCLTVVVFLFGYHRLDVHEKGIKISSPDETRSKYLPKKKKHLILSKNFSLDEENLLNKYFNYVYKQQTICQSERLCGPQTEAGYNVCEDTIYIPREPCIVYSFGSMFVFGFEVDVIKNYNCEVHTFDPSVPLTHGRKIAAGVQFHFIGLGPDDFTTADGWKMKTLASIMRELGHSNKTVDILKIDIEGWEWKAIPEMLLSRAFKRVKQLVLEFHVGPEMERRTRYKTFSTNNWGFVSMNEQMNVIQQLYENGFRIFNSKENPLSKVYLKQLRRHVTTCNVISFINTSFKNQ